MALKKFALPSFIILSCKMWVLLHFHTPPPHLPYRYWWLIMKNCSWKLYHSPNPNPRGYESAIVPKMCCNLHCYLTDLHHKPLPHRHPIHIPYHTSRNTAELPQPMMESYGRYSARFQAATTWNNLQNILPIDMLSENYSIVRKGLTK